MENGISYVLCGDGAAVLAVLDTFTPDVLIMDAFLQHIDALGVIEKVKKQISEEKGEVIKCCNCLFNSNFIDSLTI